MNASASRPIGFQVPAHAIAEGLATDDEYGINSRPENLFGMEGVVQFMPYLIGVTIMMVGIKSVLMQEATIGIRRWDKRRADDDEDAVASAQNGFIAVLIGLAQIGIGLGVLLKAPGFAG